MRSRAKELQENDIKTKEPKKNELKKNRERGKIRWRYMFFFLHKRKVDSKREGQKKKDGGKKRRD